MTTRYYIKKPSGIPGINWYLKDKEVGVRWTPDKEDAMFFDSHGQAENLTFSIPYEMIEGVSVVEEAAQ